LLLRCIAYTAAGSSGLVSKRLYKSVSTTYFLARQIIQHPSLIVPRPESISLDLDLLIDQAATVVVVILTTVVV
jgi:hypothetical protein